MDAIFKRRSIRRYTEEDISDFMVKKILEAGMNAPSAGNEQPWHFIVVREKSNLKEISKCSSYSWMLKDATVGIIVCGDLSLAKHGEFWIQDCSAATENMLIEIAELGLGGVWLGVYPVEERVKYLRKYFNLPDHIVPFSIISIGYPAQEIKEVNRYREERVHYEKW